jgi:hypothetical protein
MQEIRPQLWISQAHHLFVDRHKEGLIEVELERLNMDEHFLTWESRNQEHLSTLVGLITEIREIEKRVKGGKCTLVCKMEKPRVLRIYRRNGKNFFLPVGAREKCRGTDIRCCYIDLHLCLRKAEVSKIPSNRYLQKVRLL